MHKDCKLFPFGSVILGSHNKNSDIDVVGVCPFEVSQDYFFIKMEEILETHSDVFNLNVTRFNISAFSTRQFQSSNLS